MARIERLPEALLTSVLSERKEPCVGAEFPGGTRYNLKSILARAPHGERIRTSGWTSGVLTHRTHDGAHRRTVRSAIDHLLTTTSASILST